MKQSLAKALLSFCSLLAVAGCVTTLPPEQSPVMLDIPSLASASREAVSTSSYYGGDNINDSLTRYRAPGSGDTVALIRLRTVRSDEIGQLRFFDFLREKSRTQENLRADIHLATSCNYLFGYQSQQRKELENEIANSRVDENVIREDIVERDFGDGVSKHQSHAKTIAIKDAGRTCIGFSQCLPHRQIPKGWNFANVSGFYCLPEGETADADEPRRVVDAIVIRPEQVPRP